MRIIVPSRSCCWRRSPSSRRAVAPRRTRRGSRRAATAGVRRPASRSMQAATPRRRAGDAEDRAPRRHRPGEPHVRQLLRHWCTAPTGSNPTCTKGPVVLRGRPGLDPGSQTTVSTMNDAFNAARDPDHMQACEVTEIDGGKMDGFVTSTAVVRLGPQNFAYADSTVQAYWTFAQQRRARRPLLPADRRGEHVERHVPRAGAVRVPRQRRTSRRPSARTCSTNSATDAVHRHDHRRPPRAGRGRRGPGTARATTTMVTAHAQGGACPTAPAATAPSACPPTRCVYDPGDDPFAYYKELVDNPTYFKDYTALATDLSGRDSRPRSRSSRRSATRASTPATGTPSRPG